MLKRGAFIIFALTLVLTACNGGTTTPDPGGGSVGVGTLIVQPIGTFIFDPSIGTPIFDLPDTAFI